MPDNHETELVEALPGAAPLESVVEAPGGLSLGSILGGATSARAGPSAAAGNLRPDQVVALQRSAGNQSVSRLIAPGVPFAPFLGLDEPEREEDDTGAGLADAVAKRGTETAAGTGPRPPAR